MSKIHRLSDFKLSKIKIKCSCGRAGSYDRDRVIQRLGDIPLSEFIASIGSKCPRWHSDRERSKCGAGCDDLIYMFQATPFTDEYADWQNKVDAEKQARSS